MHSRTIAGLTAALLGCGGPLPTYTAPDCPDAGPAPYSAALAKEEFWQAFHSGDVPGVATARDHLIAALGSDANDDETPRLIGMSFALTASEGAMHPTGQADALQAIMNQGAYLKQASDTAIDPYAKALDRILYAGYPFQQGLFTMDAAKLTEAHDLMDQTQREYPILGTFARATIQMRAPRSSPDFAAGVDNFFRTFELCTGTTIDRTHPNVDAMLQGTVADPLCQNNANVPHLVQGYLMTLADLLVKNRQVEAARPVYQAIKLSAGFDTWRFSGTVDERLASDLDARSAAYDSPDFTHHPLLGASMCLQCHQH